MEPVTEGGWSGNASGNYPKSHMSPFKIVWLSVGRATILRGDLLKNSLYIGHCQSRGGGDHLAQTDFATFQKWTNCPNSVLRGWGNLGNAQKKRCFFSGRSFLRLSMTKGGMFEHFKRNHQVNNYKSGSNICGNNRWNTVSFTADNYVERWRHHNCDTDDNDVNVVVIWIDDT